jgi:hypothetical protein
VARTECEDSVESRDSTPAGGEVEKVRIPVLRETVIGGYRELLLEKGKMCPKPCLNVILDPRGTDSDIPRVGPPRVVIFAVEKKTNVEREG